MKWRTHWRTNARRSASANDPRDRLPSHAQGATDAARADEEASDAVGPRHNRRGGILPQRGRRLPLETGYGGRTDERGADWICGYLIFVFACQLLLLVPGLSPVRVILRTAAFGASMALIAILPWQRDRLHPAMWAGWAIVGIVAMGMFHPTTNTLLSGLAEWMMYVAILAPLLWVSGVRIDEKGFSRIVLVLWTFHVVSATFGVLQVYFPGKLEPSLSSVIKAQGDWYVEDLKITLANGMRTFRPMGLSDTPGGAAGSGFYTVLLGSALLVWGKKWWMKPMFAGSLLVGMFCLYLSQVRSLLVMTGICVIVFMTLMALRGQIMKVMGLAIAVTAVVLLSFSWAVAVGGNSASKRLLQLVANDPGQVYYKNRGHFLEDTITKLVPAYPLGAGLGRWGMMNYYFGDGNTNPNTAMIWAEIMWTGWVLDGGVPLVLAYVIAIGVAFWFAFKIALDRNHPELGVWGSLVFAYNAGALAVTFNSPLFLSQGGLEFWLLNAAVFGAWYTCNREAKGGAMFPSSRRRVNARERKTAMTRRGESGVRA